jgi:hypothetical protein
VKVAFGVKTHSGWAAVVTIGLSGGQATVVDRRRIELVEHARDKQPYHAAERSKSGDARAIVARGIESARRIAILEMQALMQQERERGNKASACAVLVGHPMPGWSVEDILAVHFRMHKAEGVLYQDAMVSAAAACGLRPVSIEEKELAVIAVRALQTTAGRLVAKIAALGKSVGAPWGKDQKDAALAALIALQGKRRTA